MVRKDCAEIACGEMIKLMKELGVFEISDDSDLFSFGLDSLRIVEFLVLVNSLIEISIPVEKMKKDNFSTLGNVRKLYSSNFGDNDV